MLKANKKIQMLQLRVTTLLLEEIISGGSAANYALGLQEYNIVEKVKSL